MHIYILHEKISDHIDLYTTASKTKLQFVLFLPVGWYIGIISQELIGIVGKWVTTMQAVWYASTIVTSNSKSQEIFFTMNIVNILSISHHVESLFNASTCNCRSRFLPIKKNTTLLKFNIAPQKWCLDLEDINFPFLDGIFLGPGSYHLQ